MKFKYSYKTSDNITHEDVVEAASRPDAYAVLKKAGRRPIKVEPVPGEVARQRLRRIMFYAAVAIVLFSMGATGWVMSRPKPPSQNYIALAERAEAISAKALEAVAGSPVGASKVLDEAQRELKDLFRKEYPRLVDDSEATRLKAQALYGKIMMILADEREFCHEPNSTTTAKEDGKVD